MSSLAHRPLPGSTAMAAMQETGLGSSRKICTWLITLGGVSPMPLVNDEWAYALCGGLTIPESFTFGSATVVIGGRTGHWP